MKRIDRYIHAAIPRRRRILGDGRRRRHTRPRKRYLAALVALMVCVVFSPASASETDTGSTLFRSLVPMGPNHGEVGPRVTIPWRGEDEWVNLGPVRSPIPGEETVAWCVQVMFSRPDLGTDVSTEILTGTGHSPYPELALSTAQAAWLLARYAPYEDAWTNAAIATLIHANFEEDTPSNPRDSVVEDLVSATKRYDGGRIYDLARQLATQARTNTPGAFADIEVIGDSSVTIAAQGSTRSGVVSGVGVHPEEGGTWIPGVHMSLTLSGPAVFESTGTATWEGDSGDEPLTLRWNATGNGTVTVTPLIVGVASDALQHHGTDLERQNTIVFPAGTSRDIPGKPRIFPVVKDFQPILVSDVGTSHVVSIGEELTDTVTVAADSSYGNAEWMNEGGTYVPVTFTGTAYVTGVTPPQTPGSIPENATAIGTASIRADGPGTYTAKIPGRDQPGFITWVWEMDPASQGDYGLLIADRWRDAYGLAQETTSIRHRIEINTSSVTRQTKSGMYLVDDLFVTGFPSDHPRFTGGAGFEADHEMMRQDLYFFPDGVDVSDANIGEAILMGSVEVPAANGYYSAIGSTDFAVGEDPEPGTYVFVTSFVGDDRVEAFTTSVTDPTEQFVVTPHGPEIATTLTGEEGEKVIVSSGPVSLTDTVCYQNLTPGEPYTMVGTLMDKATGEAVLAEGVALTAEHSFTPVSSSGCENVVFTIDASFVRGHELVAFEQVTHGGVTVAVHTDIDDVSQTVTFAPPPDTPRPQPPAELPRTGAGLLPLGLIALTLSFGGMTILGVSRRNRRGGSIEVFEEDSNSEGAPGTVE